jgi:hypothetical protein
MVHLGMIHFGMVNSGRVGLGVIHPGVINRRLGIASSLLSADGLSRNQRSETKGAHDSTYKYGCTEIHSSHHNSFSKKPTS